MFTDLRLPDESGMDLLARIKAATPETEVIITGYGSIANAIESIKEGAHYYATKPLKLAEIRLLAKSAQDKIDMRLENLRLREALKGGEGLKAVVCNSPAIQSLFTMVRKIAPVDCNVLLQGASGTGKTLVARAIHQLSPGPRCPS